MAKTINFLFPFYLCTIPSVQANDFLQPNIVFILADDLGYTDLGCMGSDFYETPHIDSLRASGMLFTRTYTNAANSAPSRACLMTGKYAPRHGVYTVNPPDRGRAEHRKLIPSLNKQALPVSFTLFPKLLKESGYHTIHVGKWHLGNDEEGTGPIAHGFDVNIAGGNEGAPYSYFYPYCSVKKQKCLSALETGQNGEYLTDRLTNEAINQLKQTTAQPFFLYFAHYAVHTPLQAKEDVIKKYQNKTPGKKHKNPVYAAMVESLDQSVGRIINTLKELDKLDNTLIVFMSDNGGMLNGISDNSPLRAGKGTPYEGGNRVPLIIQWNGKVPSGTLCTDPIIGVDLYPTLLEAAGITLPADLDGMSLQPLLSGQAKKTPERDLFVCFPAYLENYGSDSGFRATPYSSIISGNWKLIHFFEDNRDELYNLQEDISEKKDLSQQNIEKKQELLDRLHLWEKQVKAPVSFEINPVYKSIEANKE